MDDPDGPPQLVNHDEAEGSLTVAAEGGPHPECAADGVGPARRTQATGRQHPTNKTSPKTRMSRPQAPAG